MPTFLRQVAATIAAHRMISPGQKVLVAISGGPDSTALLHAMHQLEGRLRCELAACHIHHGLRGGEADTDAEHAAAQASGLQIPFLIKRADVLARARKRGSSLEAAAREARYELLDRVAAEMDADRIATGHTADDQAETVLLNLLRGAGPAGLGGMPPVRGSLIRPLLEVRRSQVEEYCRAEGLSYRTDRSNLDLRYARNRIRHQIMPRLREIQPRVTEALCRLARIMRDENAFLAAEAARRMAEGELASEGLEGLVLPLEPFAALPPALQRRVARAAIARAAGRTADIELERVEALAKLITAGRTGARIDLPHGLQAHRTYGEVIIPEAEAGEAAPPTGCWHLPVPGQVWVPELDAEFRASRSAARRPPRDAFAALIDAAKVTDPLQVRTWRPGDRFIPCGMARPVKLQDFFVNQKVPRALRGWVPLVLCGERIVWVVGHRVSEEFKVTSDTKRTIRIEATVSLTTSE